MPTRVLVVDDSATVRRVVARTLTHAGYEVTTASDGREALDLAQQEVPDLVLVDFVMPRMNGLAFVQAMRNISNLSGLPVVLMSAKADRIGDGFVAQTGALDAITKPFSPEALLTVTGHALSRWADSQSRALDTEPPPADAGRISVPPLDEPVSESSPMRLAEAAEKIAARLGAAISERVGGAAGGYVSDALADFEPAELFELVDALASQVPGRDGEVALAGRLEHVALGEILQLLTHQRQTGVLEIEKQPSASDRAIAICLREGKVDLALGQVREEEFRLGRYLLKEELVEREDLDRLLERGERGRGLLGARLVKLGYITADELRGLLVEQTSELIYEALRWPRGRYRFTRFASRPEADDAHLDLPLPSLLMEGLRRVDEWRLIEEQIRSFDMAPQRDEDAIRSLDPDRLSAEERRVLAAVDGVRTVREIVGASRMGSFDVCKVLFQMLTSRVLRPPVEA